MAHLAVACDNALPQEAMSTLVFQERHLWLSLAEMSDVDKVHFLDAPVSKAGLFSEHCRGLCPAVLSSTEPDLGHPTHLAPA